MAPTVADGGARGLELMQQAREQGEPFQVVLLDVHMPEMDGFTVAERIHQGHHTTNRP